jgi:hypothetical protein
VVLCCISLPFGRLSTTRGKITYVLLTRAPLYRGLLPFSCDLHVLSAPLTFVLSQDQTLQLDLEELRQLSVAGKTAPCSRQALECAIASLSHSPKRARLRLVCHPISQAAEGRANKAPHLSSMPSFGGIVTYDSVFKERGEETLSGPATATLLSCSHPRRKRLAAAFRSGGKRILLIRFGRSTSFSLLCFFFLPPFNRRREEEALRFRGRRLLLRRGREGQLLSTVSLLFLTTARAEEEGEALRFRGRRLLHPGDLLRQLLFDEGGDFLFSPSRATQPSGSFQREARSTSRRLRPSTTFSLSFRGARLQRRSPSAGLMTMLHPDPFRQPICLEDFPFSEPVSVFSASQPRYHWDLQR